MKIKTWKNYWRHYCTIFHQIIVVSSAIFSFFCLMSGWGKNLGNVQECIDVTHVLARVERDGHRPPEHIFFYFFFISSPLRLGNFCTLQQKGI